VQIIRRAQMGAEPMACWWLIQVQHA